MLHRDILVIHPLATELNASSKWRITGIPIRNIIEIKFGRECLITGTHPHRKPVRIQNIISINKGAGLCPYFEELVTRKDMDLAMFLLNCSVTPPLYLNVESVTWENKP